MPGESRYAARHVDACGYRAGERLWAFNRMGSARREIGRVTGLRFWKLLGAGHGGGFGLLTRFLALRPARRVEDAEAADRFFADSSVMASYRRHVAKRSGRCDCCRCMRSGRGQA